MLFGTLKGVGASGGIVTGLSTVKTCDGASVIMPAPTGAPPIVGPTTTASMIDKSSPMLLGIGGGCEVGLLEQIMRTVKRRPTVGIPQGPTINPAVRYDQKAQRSYADVVRDNRSTHSIELIK